MAGAGYKLFNTGDVLTAAQVNTYLQEQTVMRFATTTARDTALSGVLAEGMICYIDADNNLYKYTGSAWVNIDSGSVSPLTTKGDLYTYSTTDARLAVGNNGDTIIADSSQTTGLRYNPLNVVGNPIINGGMDIWQRGTSFVGTAYNYCADRFMAFRGAFAAGLTMSRQTSNLTGLRYSLRLQRDSGNTSTNAMNLRYAMETADSIPFAGKAVTFSFYARKGANYSATSTFAVVYYGTGTDQSPQTLDGGWTGSGNLTALNINSTLTTSFQRFVITGTLPSSITQIGLDFNWSPSGTAGADDWIELTGLQIDIGTYTASTVPSFRRAGITFAGELALAQRYYYRTTASAVYSFFCNGNAYSTTVATCVLALPQTLRTNAATLDTSGTASHYRVINGSTSTACSSVPTLDQGGTDSVGINFTVASGLTAGQALNAGANNTTSAYLGVSAEL